MKEIEGFVCVARNDKVDVIYGPSKKDRIEPWESFITNNLTVFNNPEKAGMVRKELESLEGFGYRDVPVFKLNLRIAETQSELDLIAQETGFVILQLNEQWGEIKLYGPHVQGKSVAEVLPCSPLELNGLHSFPRLEPAIYAAQELLRQGGLPTQIAIFSLKVVPDKVTSLQA